MILMEKTEVYKISTEEEAIRAIEDFREQSRHEPFEVKKAAYVKREKKKQGEVIDTWFKLSITFAYEFDDLME